MGRVRVDPPHAPRVMEPVEPNLDKIIEDERGEVKRVNGKHVPFLTSSAAECARRAAEQEVREAKHVLNGEAGME